MYVYVRGDTEIETLEVEPTDTILNLMEQIEERTGAPPILQRLIVNGCGHVAQLYHDAPGTLADNKIHEFTSMTVLYCVSGWHKLRRKTLEGRRVDVHVAPAAEDDDKAEVEEEEMRVVVRDHLSSSRCGQEFTLRVRASDTVAGVMAQVQRRLGYPPDLQQLFVEHTRERLYHDSAGTLADYNVENGSTLLLDLSGRAAVAADVEERKLKKAKEIAAAIEGQKLKKAKEAAPSIEDQKVKETDSDTDGPKVKKAKVDETAGVQSVQTSLSDGKSPAQE